MAIVWGAISGSGSYQGRIGIDINYKSETDTTVQVIGDVYYQSRYSVQDSSNSFSYSNWEGHSAEFGSKSINHSSNSSWSDSNITYIGKIDNGFKKTKGGTSGRYVASFSGIEYGGGSGSVTVPFSVPSLASYTISYNANGGSGAPSSQTKWFGENLTLSSTVPSRSGYTFLGWSTSSSGSVVYGAEATYSANASVTLYAKWQAHTYTVRYDANGGSNAPSSQIKTHDVTLTLSSTKPTRTNYVFLGWSTHKTATTATYSAGSKYTANSGATLYAVWQLDYIVPRISSLKIERCDSSGNVMEYGTNAKITFDWETDRTGASYAVYYKPITESSYTKALTISLSGTSGTVTKVITEVTFDTAITYNIQLNVADSNGYSSSRTMLSAVFMAMDATPDGRSMSFGVPTPDTDGFMRLGFPKLDITPTESFTYKGENFFGARLICSLNLQMGASDVIQLDKKISETKNGILLAFARDGSYNFTHYFIPKETVMAFGTVKHCFPFATSLFEYVGTKTLTISDTEIKGEANNTANGTSSISGITYRNGSFYLKRIYEV